MRTIYFLTLACLLLFGATAEAVFAAESSEIFSQRWDYQSNSSGGIGESTGLVDFSRASRRTTDRVEKVVLWYANRVRLPEDHTLVENAKLGFSNLKNELDIRMGVGHDTDERRDHLSILGTITSKHAHVTMIYQPDLDKKTDVIISITQTPDGANVHVFRQNLKKK